MPIKNISELKHYSNFQNSGLGVLNTYLRNLLNCKINFQHQKIDDFERVMSIDLTSNIKRYYYRLDNNRIILSIKIIDKPNIIAIMPILIEGIDITIIESYIFEQIASAITIQMTKCYLNSFHGGTQLMGIELEQLVIAKCFARRAFDPARIALLISFIEKISHTTFEGKFFSSGFILTRAMHDYRSGKSKHRDGILYNLNATYDIVRNPDVNKRFWYLVDGRESFYVFDQRLEISNSFALTNTYKTWNNFFDSYFLKSVLYGKDIVFRTISPNQVSIMNSDSIEFVKVENSWRLRDYRYLENFIDKKNRVGKKLKRALIYYISKCSREGISTIIWVPKKLKKRAISEMLLTQSSMFSPHISILSTTNEETIMRILSSDGVTVIDTKGNIKYHGCIVDLNTGVARGLSGTGETAAKILSTNGIAIKISQDGNIKIFYSIDEDAFVF